MKFATKEFKAVAGSQKRPKILVIDDIAANLTAIEVLLKPLDADVITATSGNEGLAVALKHNDIALVLLDVNMPDMNGFEVAELLNGIEETANLSIIFLSAQQPSEQNLLQGYESGAVDYILKPINAHILLSKTRIFINIWNMHYNMEQEIERRLIAEREIEYQAMHDPLTQLPNRWHIQDSIKQAIDRAKRQESQLAILFLDLDGFKKINDELGHDAGDAFLKELSTRFKENIRSSDLIARIGGDEFIIVFTDVSDTLSLTNKLIQLIDVASRPAFWHGNEMRAGASIGVSMFPEHGTEGDLLIKCADNAMYQAKEAGRNCFRFYSRLLNDALQRKLLLESHLRRAIEFNELELYFQPIINTNSGKVSGAEALLRWFSRKLGSISPVEFIPIAESAGIIHELGIWVLNEAVKTMQKYPQLCIAINVSALQFNNDQLIDVIENHLLNGTIKANQLVVEITEGILLENTNEIRERLETIKGWGVKLSIDDFGTGYSSLSYLKRCPVHKLKIDQSFVTDVPNDSENVSLIKGIIAMAHALDMNVVAEGVETFEQWEFLRLQGCDSLQGYYFSKPLSLQHFDEYLEQQKSNTSNAGN
mgnify:CR=1 FL=1